MESDKPDTKHLYDFSDSIKNVSIMTGISILFIILVFFLPFMNSFIGFIGKIAIIFVLSYALLLNLTNTNKVMTNIDNIFMDPSKSGIRNIMVLSYVFSIGIVILIGTIIYSFF